MTKGQRIEVLEAKVEMLKKISETASKALANHKEFVQKLSEAAGLGWRYRKVIRESLAGDRIDSVLEFFPLTQDCADSVCGTKAPAKRGRPSKR